MVEGVSWGKKSVSPIRGFSDTAAAIPEASRRNADQNVNVLELMLGQIANYCRALFTNYYPILSRNTIVRNASSVSNIWQSIHLHYGFQSTEVNFIDFDTIRLEPDEKPEDLF